MSIEEMTIDETIDGLRDQMGFGDPVLINAILHLKAYKENKPLTWEDLKSMEGKPVWVEMDGYTPVWGIIMNQDKRNGRLCLCGYDKVPIRIEINEDGEGNIWQAYRKERK